MNVNFGKLKSDATYLMTVLTVNSLAANMAASKALAEINDEKRTGTETEHGTPGIDEFAEVSERAKANEDAGNDEGMPERQIGFVEWCVVLAATNDELITLADGRKWPAPQDLNRLLDFKATIQVIPVKRDDIKEFRSLLEAAGQDPNKITDDEIAKMVGKSNLAKAQGFAKMFSDNRQDIIDRMQAGINNYNRHSETDWATVFNNLPDPTKLMLLKATDTRIANRMNELIEGTTKSGKTSGTAYMPLLDKASEMMELRAGKSELHEILKTFAAYEPDPVRSGPLKRGIKVIQESDGPAADAALATAGKLAEPGSTMEKAMSRAVEDATH